MRRRNTPRCGQVAMYKQYVLKHLLEPKLRKARQTDVILLGRSPNLGRLNARTYAPILTQQ